VPKELVPLVGKSELSGTGYPTKVAAERAADDAIASVRAGQQHVGGLTVGKYLTEQWLPGKRKLRPSTRARYEQFIRLYLVPYLGDLPLTGLRAGRYVLVHRVNADGRLRELRHDNDAASLLLRLRWRRGVPYIRVLAVCPDSARCP